MLWSSVLPKFNLLHFSSATKLLLQAKHKYSILREFLLVLSHSNTSFRMVSRSLSRFVHKICKAFWIWNRSFLSNLCNSFTTLRSHNEFCWVFRMSSIWGFVESAFNGNFWRTAQAMLNGLDFNAKNGYFSASVNLTLV